MGTRPTRMPRWAYDPPAGAIVEPDSGHAEDGFASAERPPAQWINYLLHYQLAWCDYLRGPAWGQWSREAHGGTIATLATVAGAAVDTDDARARAQRYRYALVGHTSAPAPKIGVSKNGRTWGDRSVPTGFVGTARGIAYGAGLWILWGTGTSETWTTIADDGTANSAIGTDDATKWSTLTDAGGYQVGGVAWNGGAEIYLCDRLNSGNTTLIRTANNGTTWTLTSAAWGSASHTGADIAYDDSRSRYVLSSSIGGIGTHTPASGSPWSGVLAVLPGIAVDADVRLRVGGPDTGRTLLAWASYRHDGTTTLASTLIWRCTDGGSSWTAVTLATGMSAITDIAYVDGVWLATSSAAPYLWRSDDDGTTWERVPLPIAEESSWALHRAVYADGQIVATGLTWTVTSGRASATSPGTWTSTEPGYLADAGYLRGRRIHTTAPSDGQVYAWNAATSRWEPVAASSLSVTTTRGDLIRRGASADERLALGAAASYLRSDGTDPSWSALLAADLSGAPWTAIIPQDSTLTSDATTTTLATIATTTDRGHSLDITVSAIRSDYSDQVTWKLLASVTNAGGVVTIRNTLITPDDGGASPWTVALDVSGTSVRVRVTGAAATDLTWAVVGTVLRFGG